MYVSTVAECYYITSKFAYYYCCCFSFCSKVEFSGSLPPGLRPDASSGGAEGQRAEQGGGKSVCFLFFFTADSEGVANDASLVG